MAAPGAFVMAKLMRPETEEPETGGTDEGELGPLEQFLSGCGCNSTGSPAGLSLVALLGAIALLRRRQD